MAKRNARRPSGKANEPARPKSEPKLLGPVLLPDHEETLDDATWSRERTERFNPADAPMKYARSWVDGYEYRLGEAERSRHYIQATDASFQQMLGWADNRKADRCIEAVELLLERIRQHSRPPYSPEVLLVEYKMLHKIPVFARIRDGFCPRLHAWLDRVETFLSIGSTDLSTPTLPTGDDQSDGPSLTPKQCFVLQTMARIDGSKLLSAKMIAAEMGAGSRLSEETVRVSVLKLIESNLAERPEGERSGARLNTAGRKLAWKIAD